MFCSNTALQSMDMTLVRKLQHMRYNQRTTSARTRIPATVEVPKDKTMMTDRTQLLEQKKPNSTDPPDGQILDQCYGPYKVHFIAQENRAGGQNETWGDFIHTYPSFKKYH